jgi:hypothetical protein
VDASSLIEVARCHLGAAGAPAGAPPAPLREVLAARLTDPRKPRGIRHSLGSLVSVLVAGVACGYCSPLAIAGAAAGSDQEVLAAHGSRRNPVTRLHEPPSASTLDQLPVLLDAAELEAGLTAWLARQRWTRTSRPGSPLPRVEHYANGPHRATSGAGRYGITGRRGSMIAISDAGCISARRCPRRRS